MISGCSKSLPSQNCSPFQYTIVRRCCIRLLLDFPGFNAPGKYCRSEGSGAPPLLCSIIAPGQPKGTRGGGGIMPSLALLCEPDTVEVVKQARVGGIDLHLSGSG